MERLAASKAAWAAASLDERIRVLKDVRARLLDQVRWVHEALCTTGACADARQPRTPCLTPARYHPATCAQLVPWTRATTGVRCTTRAHQQAADMVVTCEACKRVAGGGLQNETAASPVLLHAHSTPTRTRSDRHIQAN